MSNSPHTAPLHQEPIFQGLARPTMVFGVTYRLFWLNALVNLVVFVLLRLWALPVALFILTHVTLYILCLRDPAVFGIWATRLGRIGFVPNYWSLWHANSYAP